MVTYGTLVLVAVFVQGVIESMTIPDTLAILTTGSFAVALGWNLKETISIGKKLGRVCERFVHTPSEAAMKDHVSGETRRVRDEVTDIVGNVQIKSFELADEVEAIKIKCAKTHGGDK